MTTETTSNTRTLKAYAIELLKFPRWHIEREVDFTDCRHDAQYDPLLAECVDCQFGPACRWLDQHRTSLTDDASLDELVEAIASAAQYLQATTQKRGGNNAEVLAWIREARRFLRARHD
jgi:hypothetical protein